MSTITVSSMSPVTTSPRGRWSDDGSSLARRGQLHPTALRQFLERGQRWRVTQARILTEKQFDAWGC